MAGQAMDTTAQSDRDSSGHPPVIRTTMRETGLRRMTTPITARSNGPRPSCRSGRSNPIHVPVLRRASTAAPGRATPAGRAAFTAARSRLGAERHPLLSAAITGDGLTPHLRGMALWNLPPGRSAPAASISLAGDTVLSIPMAAATRPKASAAGSTPAAVVIPTVTTGRDIVTKQEFCPRQFCARFC